MFRRHPETRLEWQEDSPAGCAARQTRILQAAVQMLRPGGRLVYSTCTLNLEENEQVVAGLLESCPELCTVPFALPIGGGKELAAPEGLLHLFPHQFKGEGHFVAQLRKADTADGEATEFLPASKQLAAPDKAMAAAYAAFCKAFGGDLPEGNACFGDMLIAAPDLPPLKGLKVLRAGLQLGSMKGKIFMPDHALAMGLPTGGGYPSVPVDEAQAAAYQRGETLPAPDRVSGYCLVTLDGLALGFGKASGGQLKNHYPKGLRRP
jgi:NOL1/NOP2/fmu family ribosome biogenesis protein